MECTATDPICWMQTGPAGAAEARGRKGGDIT
jgi:hypothetical protein